MTLLQTLDAQLATRIPNLTWDAPDFSALPLAHQPDRQLGYRLFRLHEISEDKPTAYRQAIANVFSSLNASGCACVYLLSGKPEGVELYVGVVADAAGGAACVHEAAKTLKAGFEGNFLGARLVETRDDAPELRAMLAKSRHFGLMTGVPSLNQEPQHAQEDESQGVERLVNSLLGETWQLTVVATPASDEDIRDTLEQVYDLASEVSAHIKQSVQRSENTGYQFTDTTGSSDSRTQGRSESDTQGTSKGSSVTETRGTSDSNTRGGSTSDTRGMSKGVNESKGSSDTKSGSSWNRGSNDSRGTNSGTSESHTTGTSASITTGRTDSSSHGRNDGSSESRTTGTNDATTTGRNTSRAEGHSGGRSSSLTSERTDKRAEGMLKHLGETLVDRFLRGRSKGMYRTAIYLSAENRSTYDRLARGALSTFQGNQSGVTPLRVHKLPDRACSLRDLLQERRSDQHGISTDQALVHSTPLLSRGAVAGATWLNTEELALVAGMPARELPGLKIRKSVDFALNTSDRSDTVSDIALGHIVQHGRSLPHSVVRLSPEDLCKHVFVTGVTGAGKTTTCLKLLIESKLPFLVIEPAKTEYRALHGTGLAVEYYCLGREDLALFRLNPFELVSRHQSLASHIDTLKATLAAVFPMEAAMPQIVEEAIINAYAKKGWMIHENENLLVDDPWAPDSDVWPAFSDMIGELDAVIKSKKMGTEFEEKYRGSLVARLTSLTLGTKGRMLNTRRSMNLDQLLDKRVVIELEELKDEQDKALLMGLILTRLAECMKQRHREQPGFRHLTLVEEAHRLLSRPEPGDPGSKKMGVEMFANLLAEVRKYGEGLIIADQIPNKLVSDVIKNTNTKIVHRLFAADDRNTIGDAMGLSDEQKDFLPMLQPGETIIYCGGWHGPVRLKITETVKTNGAELGEAEIRLHGQRQLWDQRGFLFPRLAAHPLLDTPEMLAEFLRDATLMLNMLLKLHPKRKAQADAVLRERLRERLVRKHQGWLNRPGFGESPLANGLCRVVQDCAVQTTVSLGSRDVEILQDGLKQAFHCLQESLADFDKLLCRDSLFDFLRNIDSI
ncbi:MAG: hypothetical protein RL654_329 [Pseudomonadota bacterium]|jgi:hypothetical protein